MKNQNEIKIGDLFVAKPSTQFYQDCVLEVVKIAYQELPENQRIFYIETNRGEKDSFYRDSLFAEYEKLPV